MEYEKRQEMIDSIEGIVGIWKAVWNEWPTAEIEILFVHLTAPAKTEIEKFREGLKEIQD